MKVTINDVLNLIDQDTLDKHFVIEHLDKNEAQRLVEDACYEARDGSADAKLGYKIADGVYFDRAAFCDIVEDFWYSKESTLKKLKEELEG